MPDPAAVPGMEVMLSPMPPTFCSCQWARDRWSAPLQARGRRAWCHWDGAGGAFGVFQRQCGMGLATGRARTASRTSGSMVGTGAIPSSSADIKPRPAHQNGHLTGGMGEAILRAPARPNRRRNTIANHPTRHRADAAPEPYPAAAARRRGRADRHRVARCRH
jgi:hypothetical protein